MSAVQRKVLDQTELAQGFVLSFVVTGLEVPEDRDCLGPVHHCALNFRRGGCLGLCRSVRVLLSEAIPVKPVCAGVVADCLAGPPGPHPRATRSQSDILTTFLCGAYYLLGAVLMDFIKPVT